MINVRDFTFKELIRTDVPNVDNVPVSMEVVRNILFSSECLQLIRDSFGFPVKVNSGYRSSVVNSAVGGVSNSYHLQGLAFDIRPVDLSKIRDFKRVVLDFVSEHPLLVREHIVYESFVHVAFKFS